ncbi:hypothetical protein B0T13DRAFT_446299 [Neurospora crassa]|nr:hypothetical protein B0T13DRAFT_446299 [Neurospora crassa]
MPSSPQTPKPLLFRLPLEVRLMIYRHAWKVDPKPHTIRSSRQLMASYLKQQLTAIGRLGAICQQMRTEAFDEYFHHAQAYIRYKQKQLLLSLANVRGLKKVTIKDGDNGSWLESPENSSSRLHHCDLCQKFKEEFEDLVTLPKNLVMT